MRLVCKISGWIVSLMGLFFLFSWHLNFTSFLKCDFCTWPMPYAAGLCLFLSGLALLYLTSSIRLPVSNVLGCMIFFTAFERGIELLLPANSMLNLLLNEIHVFPFLSTQMTLTSVLAFALIGMSFLFWQRGMHHSIRNIFSLIVAGTVVFLASAVIFVDLLSSGSSSEIDKFLMHFYTALGLLIIGLGFIFGRYSNLPEKNLQ